MKRVIWASHVACSLFFLSACVSTERTVEEEEALPLPTRIIDLSPTITEDLPVRIWGSALLEDHGFRERTEFEHIVNQLEPRAEWDGYVANSYWTLMNHGGPHVDAPNHMIEDAPSIVDYELEQLIGPVHLLDVRSFAPNESVPRSFVEAQGVDPGDIVILFVGYVPPSEPNEFPIYPYLSGEAAEYLAELPIKAFATDALSSDAMPQPEDAPERMDVGPVVHSAFLPRGIPVIEQLVNVESLLNEDNAVFVGFPLKVEGGNGSPIRAAALIYEN